MEADTAVGTAVLPHFLLSLFPYHVWVNSWHADSEDSPELAAKQTAESNTGVGTAALQLSSQPPRQPPEPALASNRVVADRGAHGHGFLLLEVALRAEGPHEDTPELTAQQTVEEEVGGSVDDQGGLSGVEDVDGGDVVGGLAGDGRDHVDGGQDAADEVAEGDAKHDVRQTWGGEKRREKVRGVN